MREQTRGRLWLLIILLGLGSILTLRPSMAQVRLTIEAVVLQDANLRFGPGVAYPIIGTAQAGQLVTVTDDEGSWYQLSTGEWIAKVLVAATAESRVVTFRLAEAPAFAKRNANLRSGPGTTFPLVGELSKRVKRSPLLPAIRLAIGCNCKAARGLRPSW